MFLDRISAKIYILQLLTILFCACLFTPRAFAYPQFVGFGYTSCVACHYNPFGNGPLNDYGRALSATAVSSRGLYHHLTTEEEIANRSGTFGKIPKQQWIRPSVDYRGLLLKRSLGEMSEDTQWINMMADLNVVLRMSEDNSFFMSASIGYAPTPLSLKGKEGEDSAKKYRSREHYIGIRPVSSFGVYIGLMDKIYGLRIPEHTSYARAINGLSQNDQSHGIQLHYAHSFIEIGLNYFIGNLVQETNLRQKGYSAKIDYVFSHKGSLGFSIMSSTSDFVENSSRAIHYMGAVGKGSSVLIEVGQNNKKSSNELSSSSAEAKQDSTYGLAQGYFKLDRGYYLFNTLEYLAEDDGDYRVRFGPGLQFFPIQRIETRFEILNTRSLSDAASTKDTWDFLAQLHLWF